MATPEERRALQERCRAFVQAAGAGDLKLMRALIGEDRRVLIPDTPLLEACLRGQVEAVRLMLDEGVSPDPPPGKNGDQSRRALTRVMRRTKAVRWTAEHRRVLELLLERGATTAALPSWDGASALTAAASAANREAIDILRRHDPSPLDLFDAAALADLETVEKRLAPSPEKRLAPSPEKRLAPSQDLARAVSPGNATALQYCAHSALGTDDPEAADRLRRIAERLLAAGAPIDPPDRGPQTTYPAVYLACRAGNDEVTLVLLAAGADPNYILHRALAAGRPRVLEKLAERREELDLDRRLDDRRRSPLLVEVVRSGQLSSAGWLVEQGADPDAADSEGTTALHLAARRRAVDLLVQLLEGGANRVAKDAAGRTALDLASSQRKTAALEYLKPAS